MRQDRGRFIEGREFDGRFLGSVEFEEGGEKREDECK